MPNPTSLNFIQLSYNRLKLFYYYFDLEEVVTACLFSACAISTYKVMTCIKCNCRNIKTILFSGLCSSCYQGTIFTKYADFSTVTSAYPPNLDCCSACRCKFNTVLCYFTNCSCTTPVDSLLCVEVISKCLLASVNLCLSTPVNCKEITSKSITVSLCALSESLKIFSLKNMCYLISRKRPL